MCARNAISQGTKLANVKIYEKYCKT
jgi:hypothetical protein